MRSCLRLHLRLRLRLRVCVRVVRRGVWTAWWWRWCAVASRGPAIPCAAVPRTRVPAGVTGRWWRGPNRRPARWWGRRAATRREPLQLEVQPVAGLHLRRSARLGRRAVRVHARGAQCCPKVARRRGAHALRELGCETLGLLLGALDAALAQLHHAEEKHAAQHRAGQRRGGDAGLVRRHPLAELAQEGGLEHRGAAQRLAEGLDAVPPRLVGVHHHPVAARGRGPVQRHALVLAEAG
mmetsp:Transcript_6660/g.18389  ORF Transcript_6660/g.18389 Transcript_6660/m.18389 type:complete len:238 (-) Transcript_6660:510-1223(-)